MNAKELFAQLGALPAVRRLPSGDGAEDVVSVASIEVVQARRSEDRSLRQLWRARQSGSSVPVLVVADEPATPGCLRALGVTDGGSPIRSVEASALAAVLAKALSLSQLEAVREVAAELERLDRAGIPGLVQRQLLTHHTLDVRLRRHRERWAELETLVAALPRARDWQTVLATFGYTIEQLPHYGRLLRYQGAPVAVVHPKADPAEFARLAADGRPPEGQLLNDCLAHGADYGLLCAGSRLRLFEARPQAGPASSQYLDLDATALQADDVPFLGLLTPRYLAEGGFAALQEEARSFGAALRRRVDETIRQKVLPALARALGRWARTHGREPADDAVREELERASLTLIFRALFMLYAESAGFLPVDNQAYRSVSLTHLVEEADASRDSLDPASTALWNRFTTLVKAMRTGNRAWNVPAYNGALFAADGFDGAETLESLELQDPDFAAVLVGLGRDPESGGGVDFSTLQIGHLGHIYEGLLSLRLSVAAKPLRYDARRDSYEGADHDVADVAAGDLLWQTNEGGRKGGGVYYTRPELVRHLVRQAVVPAFESHLAEVRDLAATDPAGAAEVLFDFAVLDPSCGSAHFLVIVVNELADMVVRFLAEVPLPQVADSVERLRAGAMAGAVVEDAALLRRLVLKRCVYGVDVSPMGAEIAKVSLWLASFVPGLSLAYLERNVVVGNSLVGVARPDALREFGATGTSGFFEDQMSEALLAAADAATTVARSDDRTPTDIEASRAADNEAWEATAGLACLFDLWTAEPFGLDGARQEVALRGLDILSGRRDEVVVEAAALARHHRFLHWVVAFPLVFNRTNPGFDCVVGNPPWEKVVVSRLNFFGLFRPGLHSLSERERARAVEELIDERPDLQQRLEAEQQRASLERAFLSDGGYASMPGDPDLYKFFCQRYRALLRDDGALAVVLPRTAFATEGSAGFREWLFEENTTKRIDFLTNRRRWMFETHPQYTVALVNAQAAAPSDLQVIEVAGVADSPSAWDVQAAMPGLRLSAAAFGPGWTPPLLRSQEDADLLGAMRSGGTAFALGGDRWNCFPVAELHESRDKELWKRARSGRHLWKGESFDQYEPHGDGQRWCPFNDAVKAKVFKSRPGSESLLARTIGLEPRKTAVRNEVGRPRIAVRSITRATDSRTVRACLVPPDVLLTHATLYLAFVEGDDRERSACLAILNSLPFDWQARRFIEINFSFFILEGLVVPRLDASIFETIARAAARLSAVDDRYRAFAASVDVDCGPLIDEERLALRIEVDAQVCHAWGIAANELDVMLADFTLDAVPAEYRVRLRQRLSELA